MINEIEKQQYLDIAKTLVERLGRLDIIYLRVSTKKLGQDEQDQLKPILKTFNLKVEDCLVISAKESAFQEWKQKTRKLNVIKELFEEYEEYDKILYVWSLDRIMRNSDMMVDFFRYIAKYNGIIISHREKFLHQLKEVGGGFGKAMYSFMVEIYGWMGQEESEKRGERLKKSLTKKNGRFMTNKNNLFGAKLKSTSGKIIRDVKKIEKIEKYVFKLVNEKVPYLEIVEILKSKRVKISTGYISNVKKRLKEN